MLPSEAAAYGGEPALATVGKCRFEAGTWTEWRDLLRQWFQLKRFRLSSHVAVGAHPLL